MPKCSLLPVFPSYRPDQDLYASAQCPVDAEIISDTWTQHSLISSKPTNLIGPQSTSLSVDGPARGRVKTRSGTPKMRRLLAAMSTAF